MTLLPRDAPTTCQSGWLAVRFTDDMPTIEAGLDGRSAPFTIDTRNNNYLALWSHWLKQLGSAEQIKRHRNLDRREDGEGGNGRR